MHDGMQYNLIQGQGQGHEHFQSLAIFKTYLLRHLQRELAIDDGFLNYLNLIGPDFWYSA